MNYSELDRTFAKHETSLSFMDWVAANIKVRTGAAWREFSFQKHQYLRAIYEDNHPQIIIMKAAQLGLSHWAMARALYFAANNSVNIGYYFPTRDKIKDFVQSKVDPVINHSPLVDRIGKIENLRRKSPDSTVIKKLDNSFLIFRGLFTVMDAKSVDLDILIIDEFDEANQDNVEFARDRILHSELAVMYFFSQPTVPDIGVDEAYAASDQRQYLIKCQSCGHWNNLVETFPDCMIAYDDSAYRGCIRCKKQLSVATGEWVAKHPNRDIHGYQVSQLHSGFIKEDYLYKLLGDLKSTAKRRRIENSILGRPFAGDRQPWNDAVFQSCQKETGFYKPEKTVMGVDTGSHLHIVIMEPVIKGDVRFLRLCKLIEVPTYDAEQLLRIALEWNVQWAVIDAAPERALAKKFVKLMEKNRRKAAIQEFVDKEVRLTDREDGFETLPVIKAPREDSLDELADAAKQGIIYFPDPKKLSHADLIEYEKAKAHLRRLVKVEVQNSRGGKDLKYKRGVENHYGLALNSCFIGARLLARFDTWQPFNYRTSKEKRWTKRIFRGL